MIELPSKNRLSPYLNSHQRRGITLVLAALATCFWLSGCSDSRDNEVSSGASGGNAQGGDGGQSGQNNGGQSGANGATGGSAGQGGAGGTAGAGGAAGVGGSAGAGPQVFIHLRSETGEFQHNDGLSGQTPIVHKSGIRKFTLYKTDNDPEPWVVFDYAASYVEADYNAGEDTIVAAIAMSELVEGTYLKGRVVHSHVTYTVKSTMHSGATSVPGQFENTQVLSDHTTLDGVEHNQGWFHYEFKTAGMSYPLEGDNAPIPEYTSSGGFSVTNENGEWAYWFPTALVVSPQDQDVHVYMDVNMFESFRWQEQSQAGYTDGVFDSTPTGAEPVKRFGANSFKVTAGQ